MNHLISIIVPIYNAEKYLDKCLNSLQIQTYSNIEIIMVDDGSADDSAQICKRYQAADPRFKYVYQENAGVSSARNKGLDLAQGDFIGFCDSDDWVEADMYETLYDLAARNEADVSIISFIADMGQTALPFEDHSEELIFDSEGAIIEMHNEGRFEGHLCNKIFKRSLFEDVRFRTDITIFEDMVAVWDLFQKADRIVFCDVHKYHYYYNPDSATKSGFKESYWSAQIACRQMADNMKKYYPNKLAIAQKTLVLRNYHIAVKLFRSRKTLGRADYLKIKQEIAVNYTEDVKKLVGSKDRIGISVFLKSKLFFTLLMYGTALKKRLIGKKIG